MAQLNEAYEVLSNPGTYSRMAEDLVSRIGRTDPNPLLLDLIHRSISAPSISAVRDLSDLTELRARFDAGDDPNDPHSGQGGSPFGGGGFGGGGQPIFFQQSGSFGGGGFQQFFQQQAGGAGGQQFFQQFGGNGGGGAQFRWG